MVHTYIGVVGSRIFGNYKAMKGLLDKIIYDRGIEYPVIVSGGAKGADSLAVQYAQAHGYRFIVYKAEWDNLDAPGAFIRTNRYGKKYNANAGFHRNTTIVEKSDFIVAFHNNSSGTLDTINKAKKLGKEVIEYKF